MARDGDGAGGVVDLWAMAAELERQFVGYKQRLAERSGGSADAAGDDDARRGGEEEEEEGGGGRGRMYEAYVRKRDERLRRGWRARMERKEAEVKALWAQLDRGGARGGVSTAADGGGTAGELKAEDDGDKRRSSDAGAPTRISGKKHARTRSFSSLTTKSSQPDVGRRRALSQEPPPSETPPAAAAGRKDGHRARPAAAAATGTAAPKRKLAPSSSGSKCPPAKEHGFAKTGPGPKPPRLPRRSNSGDLENLREAALPSTCVLAAPAQSSPSEQAQAAVVRDETPNASSSPTDAAAAADSDCGEVVDSGAPDVEAEAKNAKECRDEESAVPVPPEKMENGATTSDSETEPSYVYVKKDDVVIVVEEEEEAMRRSEALAGSNAKADFGGKTDEDNAVDTTAAESATTTTNEEETPAAESSDEPSFSGRSGGGASPPSTQLSCTSRAQSIERLLEADAALIRRKREQQSAEIKSIVVMPGSGGGNRVSGAARSPREAVRGFKRFLSFGKKNRGREVVTVIDCSSPSVPSLVDDDGANGGGWHCTDSIKPRMGSSDDAASDDLDHGFGVSPQAFSLQSLVAASPAKSELNEIVPQDKSPKAHRSFFSFRSLNCGRS